MKYKYFIFFIFNYVLNYDYDKLLTKNYKTDVEFIFDNSSEMNNVSIY